MNNIKLIEQFQKDSKKLGTDSNSVEEFKLWFEAFDESKRAAEKVTRPEMMEHLKETMPEDEYKQHPWHMMTDTQVEEIYNQLGVKKETPVEVKKEEPVEEKPKEKVTKKPESYYVLNADSDVRTDKPLENEFIVDWEASRNGMTYLLIKTPKYARPFILAGSGKGYDSVGAQIHLFDDGNETTPFDRSTSRYTKRGTPGEVIAIAENSEQITTNFPKGRYRLMVMK